MAEEEKKAPSKKSKRQVRKARRAKDRVNDWHYNLCDCCEYDAGIGVYFFACFPCAMSELVDELNDKKDGKSGWCYSTCCCFCISARTRQLALNRFRIKNDCCSREFCKAICCPCCSGAQIKNQLEYTKFKEKPNDEKMDEKNDSD